MDIIFFIAGIVLLVKKSVKVTKTKTLTGTSAKILGAIYLLPFLSGFLMGFFSKLLNYDPYGQAVSIPLIAAIFAIIMTIYFIVTTKPSVEPANPVEPIVADPSIESKL